MRTQLYETLSIKQFAAAVKARTGDAPVYTTLQNYELAFYYDRPLPLLRYHSFPEIYGRGELRPDLAPLKRAFDLGLPAYVVLRENEQFAIPRSARQSLRGVLSAAPGVFGNPVLYLIAPHTDFLAAGSAVGTGSMTNRPVSRDRAAIRSSVMPSLK